MQEKTFRKNDNGFICANCAKQVMPLRYSSRNHCPYCLCSLHVDVFPGDRANDCGGLLKPTGMRVDGKKGYVITFTCEKCGETTNNVAAADDDFDKLIELSVNGNV